MNLEIWQFVLAGIALAMIFEGLMPAIAPRLWRGLLGAVSHLPAERLRIGGLLCMCSGLALLYFAL